MPTPQVTPNVPQPHTTKKTAKKSVKMNKSPKDGGIRQPNPIRMIYAKGTSAVVADEATEKRLSPYGPPTSTRLAGYNFKW